MSQNKTCHFYSHRNFNNVYVYNCTREMALNKQANKHATN